MVTLQGSRQTNPPRLSHPRAAQLGVHLLKASTKGEISHQQGTDKPQLTSGQLPRNPRADHPGSEERAWARPGKVAPRLPAPKPGRTGPTAPAQDALVTEYLGDSYLLQPTCPSRRV